MVNLVSQDPPRAPASRPTRALILGAVEFAKLQGAPAVEAYPVENHGQKIDTTLAFVGTHSMFESAGFTKIANTDATSARLPRIIMRRQLNAIKDEP